MSLIDLFLIISVKVLEMHWEKACYYLLVTGAGAVLGGPIGAAIGAGIGVALDTFIVKGEWVTKFWKKLGETLFNWDQASVMWDYTKQVFENAFNADNFIEFGANIILGVISGISTGITWLLEPIADLFNFIVTGICDIFGILRLPRIGILMGKIFCAESLKALNHLLASGQNL